MDPLDNSKLVNARKRLYFRANSLYLSAKKAFRDAEDQCIDSGKQMSPDLVRKIEEAIAEAKELEKDLQIVQFIESL